MTSYEKAARVTDNLQMNAWHLFMDEKVNPTTAALQILWAAIEFGFITPTTDGLAEIAQSKGVLACPSRPREDS